MPSEQLTLVAQIFDRFSAPLRDMQRQLSLFDQQGRLADNPIGRFEAPAATINSPVSFRLNFCFRPKAEIRRRAPSGRS
jgi:hypothetical protein